MSELHEKIKSALDFGTSIPEIPDYVINNLRHSFFEWQQEAFQYFLLNEKKQKNEGTPTHLMFNMATGTGKTLLMAATILYYYKQGYRHFLFFVNQNNIVDKTENNFVNSNHTKYLFKDKIVIDDQTVDINKVEVFSDNPQGIEIKFTTVQKFYGDIHKEKENQTTLDDLQKLDLVLLADEAHHLNTNTKNIQVQDEFFEEELKGSAGEKEKKGWEHTVIEYVLKKYDFNTRSYPNSNKNVLLEFTATIPDNEYVAEKYQDKIIYKFGLKEFLQAGYTKEINLISSTFDKKERVLQALLFQWYRYKIALKYGIPNFKPVVLFRSKTIDESKADYNDFLNLIDEISGNDFKFLDNVLDKITQSKSIYEQGKSRTEQVLAFIKHENIYFGDISNWIKQNYQERNTIITNSRTNTTKKEKTDEETETLLNSLEDKNNHIRAIFTVDRLTEGWDVLNLFDIVRLYQGQNTGGKTKKTPEATTKEKQLIGRGVRYFPFVFNDKIANKRKFDDNLKHELRILEELYYYTYDEESKYISHLKEELRNDGYIRDDKVSKTFNIKKEFKDSDFYKDVKVWVNERIDNPNRKKKDLNYLKENLNYSYTLKGLEFKEEEVDFASKDKDDNRLSIRVDGSSMKIRFGDIDKHIVRKAINIKAKQKGSLFRFDILSQELDLESIDDLHSDLLADFPLSIAKDKRYAELTEDEFLEISLDFLQTVFDELKQTIHPKVGTKKFIPQTFEYFFGDGKTKSVDESRKNDFVVLHNWYILDSFYGSDEEENLIEFIKNYIGNLEEKFDEYYLLRNEEVYKIYSFEDGSGFQPDFLLFLKGNDNLYYQIFIEPKGNQFIGDDGSFISGKEGWKVDLLEQITQEYGLNNILKFESKQYVLIGLPFFNQNNNQAFAISFEKLINN